MSPNTVGRLLVDELAYSRQVNRKTLEGANHPDRNAQFEHINAQVIAAQSAGQPVISVDTKKKELIGNFKNGGTDYRPKGDPTTQPDSLYLFRLHREKAVARVRNVAATKLAMKPGRTLSWGSLGFSGRLYTEGRSISKKNALRSPTLVSSSTP